MIYLFGRPVRKVNRLRLAYEREWMRWARTASYGDTFPAFSAWQAFTRLPYFDGFTDACLPCLNDGRLAYPVDPRAHHYRTGHYPVLVKEEKHV
jgi:hypothetical protein